MPYFIKLLDQANHPTLRLLLSKPLWFAILILGVQRTWRGIQASPEGLEQGEFKLSYNDYPLFGLSSRSKKQLSRAIAGLIRYGFIAKSNKKAGIKGINVYVLQNREILLPYFAEEPPKEHQASIGREGQEKQKNTVNRIQIKDRNTRLSPLKPNKGGGLEGGFQAKMQKVEEDGDSFIRLWNQLTGRQDWMTKSVKAGLFDLMDKVNSQDFEERVQVFVRLKQLIIQHNIQPYLYQDISTFDLGQFLAHINAFYGRTDEEVLVKWLKEGQAKVVLRKIRNKSNKIPAKENKTA